MATLIESVVLVRGASGGLMTNAEAGLAEPIDIVNTAAHSAPAGVKS